MTATIIPFRLPVPANSKTKGRRNVVPFAPRPKATSQANSKEEELLAHLERVYRLATGQEAPR